MSRFRQIVLWVFFLAALALSLLFFWMPEFIAPQPPEPTAYLRDHHGRIALFSADPDAETPERVFELYTRLLPENDVLALQAGVAVHSEEELERLLEDYGL